MSSLSECSVSRRAGFGMLLKMGKKAPTSVDSISERLELTREALGLSQAEFARRVGITEQAYTNYKRGARRISHDQAEKLCRAIGVSLDWIYRGDMQSLRLDLATKIQEILAARRRNRA